MNNKAQELEARNIMQGLEEFANFMSFQSTTSNLRILSVETVEQDISLNLPEEPVNADILDMQQYVKNKHHEQRQSLEKSLSFID